jgi:hypothetical protein
VVAQRFQAGQLGGHRAPGLLRGRRGDVRDEPRRAFDPLDGGDDGRADAGVAADGGLDRMRVQGAAVQGDPVPDPAAELQQPVGPEPPEVPGREGVAAVGRGEADLAPDQLDAAAGEGRSERGDLLGVVHRAGELGQFEPGAGARGLGGPVHGEQPYPGAESGAQGLVLVEVEPVPGDRDQAQRPQLRLGFGPGPRGGEDRLRGADQQRGRPGRVGVQHGDALGADGPARLRGLPAGPRRQDEGAARAQGPGPARGEGGDVGAGQEEVAVGGREPGHLGPGLVRGEQPGMGHGYGARRGRSREEDGRDGPGPRARRKLRLRGSFLPRPRAALDAEADHPGPGTGVERGLVGGVGEEDGRLGGGEPALPGVRGVDVDQGVGAARLEDGEQGDDERGPPGGGDGDARARRCALGEEVVRQPVGARVELRVGEAVGARDHGGRPGGVPDPLPEAVQGGVGAALGEACGLGSLRHGPMMPPGTDSGPRSVNSVRTTSVGGADEEGATHPREWSRPDP